MSQIDKFLSWCFVFCFVIYMATGECELKEIGRTIGAQFAEGNVIQTKIFGPRKDVRIGLNAGNQFA